MRDVAAPALRRSVLRGPAIHHGEKWHRLAVKVQSELLVR